MKKSTTLFVVLALVLVFCALFTAPTYAVENDEDISISVVFTANHGSTTIANARVSLYNEAGDLERVSYTNAQGAVGFLDLFGPSDIPPVFTVVIEAEGFEVLTYQPPFRLTVTGAGNPIWGLARSVIQLTPLTQILPEPTPPPVAPTHNSVFVNGEHLELDVDPVIVNSRMMVPLGAIVEAFGARTSWYAPTSTAIIRLGELTVYMRPGYHRAMITVNWILDRYYVLDSNPVIIDGRMMVPLRIIAEIFGASAEWCSDTQSAIITL